MKPMCKFKMLGSILLASLPEVSVVVGIIDIPPRSHFLAIPHLLWVLAAEVSQYPSILWVKEHMWRFCQLLNVSISTKNSRYQFKKKNVDLWTHWSHSEIDLIQTTIGHLTCISPYSEYWARVGFGVSRN